MGSKDAEAEFNLQKKRLVGCFLDSLRYKASKFNGVVDRGLDETDDASRRDK